MDIDWSTTAAWIALAVAVLSPLLTALINNHHNRKMKMLEIFHARRFEAISAYLVAAGNVTADPTSENIAECLQALGNATIYMPIELYLEAEKFEVNTVGDGVNVLDFRLLAKKFSEYGFATKQKLW